MSMALVLRCDAPGCTAQAEVPLDLESWDISVLASADSLTLDTGWLDAPCGWTVGEQGQRCPAHVQVAP